MTAQCRDTNSAGWVQKEGSGQAGHRIGFQRNRILHNVSTNYDVFGASYPHDISEVEGLSAEQPQVSC